MIAIGGVAPAAIPGIDGKRRAGSSGAAEHRPHELRRRSAAGTNVDLPAMKLLSDTIDSTEAKLGVLALAVLAIFIGLLVEANMERAPWHSVWTVMLGVDMLPILAGMLGFKAEEPFDVPSFIAGFRFQSPQTIDAAIDAMSRRYDLNNGRRTIKERLLAVTTLLAILFVCGETARRFGAIGALVGWLSTAARSLPQ